MSISKPSLRERKTVPLLTAGFLGFPHLANRKLSKDREGVSADVVPGSKTVLPNLLPYSIPEGGKAN
jgi:hypothetical protein